MSDELTTDEKYTIIKRWCFYYDTRTGRHGTGVLYIELIRNGFRFGAHERSKKEAVDTAYTVITMRVWGLMSNEFR